MTQTQAEPGPEDGADAQVPDGLSIPAELGLPVDTLFAVDPLDLAEKEVVLLVQHYRAQRLNYLKVDAKPKAVARSRADKLDQEKSKSAVDMILANMIGGGSKDD